MDHRRRLYSDLLQDHLATHRQMAFVAGPRQVGKTTVCRALASEGGYFNWDDPADRKTILAGRDAILASVGTDRLSDRVPVVVFDELHKFAKWKMFLKGLFDSAADRVRIVVTGSSRLDVFRRGGDSLMGRYFLFRMHPFSAGELADPSIPECPRSTTRPVEDRDWQALLDHGGYPETFTRRDRRFDNRWQSLRLRQLVREDVRDLTRIQDLDRLELLTDRLEAYSGSSLQYSTLATELAVTVDTIRRWITTLTSLHFGFLVRPWFKNVAKSLRKEPKWYLSDWSRIDDPGRRVETLVACHLKKAVDTWEDCGFGRFELRYLRDKDKREVDFVVIKNKSPWFLVEVKSDDQGLSPHLRHFQDQIGAPHAFQVVLSLPEVKADPFQRHDPIIVPAKSFLPRLP